MGKRDIGSHGICLQRHGKDGIASSSLVNGNEMRGREEEGIKNTRGVVEVRKRRKKNRKRELVQFLLFFTPSHSA